MSPESMKLVKEAENNTKEIAEQNKQKWKAFFQKYAIIIVLLLLIIVISVIEPKFLSPTNIFNVLTQSCIFGIMALGMTLVITSKGIDLSIGSTLALSGVVAASLGQVSKATTVFFPGMTDLPVIVPILAALAVGALVGAVNGGLIAYTGIPAFIATLGMMTIARGATLLYTGGKPVSQFTDGLKFFGSKVGVIPVPVIVYGIMIAITWILLGHTSFGKNVYAIGGNIKAAEISGVNVKKNLVVIYAFMGICAAVAAIVFAGRVGSVHPGAATGYELTAIAATTIGGTSHYGGIGTIWGAVVGALVLGVLRNGMTLLGIHAYWQQIVEGAIIIAAVIFDMRKNAKKK
ncbi:ABC transporter permease [Bacillota bacterium]